MKTARTILAALLMLLLVLCPEAAIAGAQRAMYLWGTSVAPALFPFLALLPLLTGREACAAYRRLFSAWMRPLFGLSGAAAPALIAGMIAGSPGGALAVCRVAREGDLPQADARRLALALCGVSPAYLILGVGCALFDSRALGLKLAAIQAAVQLALLLALRGVRLPAAENAPRADAVLEKGGVRAAVESVLVVCGYMTLFGAIAAALASVAGARAGLAILLAADLPSGLAALAGVDFPGRMLLLGAAAGFGGLCIAAQNLGALRRIGVRARDYFMVRGLAAAIFACLCGAFLRSSELSGELKMPGARGAYAVSMLIACAAALPGLIYLSKNLILNKSK